MKTYSGTVSGNNLRHRWFGGDSASTKIETSTLEFAMDSASRTMLSVEIEGYLRIGAKVKMTIEECDE